MSRMIGTDFEFLRTSYVARNFDIISEVDLPRCFCLWVPSVKVMVGDEMRA